MYLIHQYSYLYPFNLFDEIIYNKYIEKNYINTKLFIFYKECLIFRTTLNWSKPQNEKFSLNI